MNRDKNLKWLLSKLLYYDRKLRAKRIESDCLYDITWLKKKLNEPGIFFLNPSLKKKNLSDPLHLDNWENLTFKYTISRKICESLITYYFNSVLKPELRENFWHHYHHHHQQQKTSTLRKKNAKRNQK